MTPLEQAQAVYREEWCARTFWEDVRLYLSHGCVISLPSVFVMGRPVKTGWSPQMMLNPEITTKDPDCWHVALYAGDLSKAFDHQPFYLPFVSFERRNRLKIYATVSLTKHLLRHDTI